MQGKILNILLVEDDSFEVVKIRRALQAEQSRHRLWVAGDGEEALAMLRGEAGREAVPKPCLVLLDLDLPKMDGIELLQELRADAKLKRTVVIVLTGSKLSTDKVNSYNLNVAGYLLKTPYEEQRRAMLSILNAYIQMVELP